MKTCSAASGGARVAVTQPGTAPTSQKPFPNHWFPLYSVIGTCSVAPGVMKACSAAYGGARVAVTQPGTAPTSEKPAPNHWFPLYSVIGTCSVAPGWASVAVTRPGTALIQPPSQSQRVRVVASDLQSHCSSGAICIDRSGDCRISSCVAWLLCGPCTKARICLSQSFQ